MNMILKFPEEQTDRVIPVISSVNIYPEKEGRVTPYIYRSDWGIEYHSKDAGLVELRNEPGKWHKRRAGSIHIYAPGCYFREDSRKANLPLENNYLTFTNGKNCGLERLINPKTLFAIMKDTDGRVADLIYKIDDLCKIGGERRFWKLQALFMEIMYLLTSARKISKGCWEITKINHELSFAETVDVYLHRNIDKNIKLADIARYMKVSESSLNQKFKEAMGISPISRLIKMRIDFAKTLLLKGEKLASIAEMTGFCDEYHLSKAFKKQTGLSSRAFKKQY